MYGIWFCNGKSTLWFMFLFPRVRITCTVIVFSSSRSLQRLRFVRLFSTTLDQIVFAAAIARRITSVFTSRETVPKARRNSHSPVLSFLTQFPTSPTKNKTICISHFPLIGRFVSITL